jgi:surface protein
MEKINIKIQELDRCTIKDTREICIKEIPIYPKYEELNIIPSVEEQVNEGSFNKVTVAGDKDLKAENIKEGVNIFGVEGVAKTTNAKITSANYLFYYGHRIDYLEEILALCDWNVITNCEKMFSYCMNLKELDLSTFDTSKVTSMYGMFENCYNLTKLDVSNFNTSNVTNMYYMFNQVFWRNKEHYDLDISNFDASKVTNIGSMFGSSRYLVDLKFMKNLGKAYTQKTENYSDYRLDLSSPYNLSYDSLMSVINNLYDLNLTYDVANGGTLYRQELKLGSTNLAKLTAEEIAIATNKGWNVT